MSMKQKETTLGGQRKQRRKLAKGTDICKPKVSPAVIDIARRPRMMWPGHLTLWD